MNRQPWDGRIEYTATVKCANCPATEVVGGHDSPAAKFKGFSWRKVLVDGDQLWCCPDCVVSRLQAALEQVRKET